MKIRYGIRIESPYLISEIEFSHTTKDFKAESVCIQKKRRYYSTFRTLFLTELKRERGLLNPASRIKYYSFKMVFTL